MPLDEAGFSGGGEVSDPGACAYLHGALEGVGALALMPDNQCPPLALWLGREAGALDAPTRARVDAILEGHGLRDGLPTDPVACASALDELGIEGFAVDRAAAVPAQCGPLAPLLEGLTPEQRLAAAAELFRSGLGPVQVSTDPVACALVEGALQRVEGPHEDLCPTLFNWIARSGRIIPPDQRNRGEAILGRYLDPNVYTRPDPATCSAILAEFGTAGIDLSSMGLRAAEGIEPDCASVSALLASGHARIPAARRVVLDSVLEDLDITPGTPSDDPVACAMVHGLMEQHGLFAFATGTGGKG